MRRHRAIVCIVVAAFLMIPAYLYAQGSSSRGTEFYTAYMEHSNVPSSGNPARMALYITADLSTTVDVDIADKSFSQTYNVTANQVTIVDIPNDAFLGGDGHYMKGIHIVSKRPIAVYAHIYAGNASGATLVLPVNTLGKEYTSINYSQQSNNNNIGNSDFVIVGTKDNTKVSITPTVDLLGGQRAGQTFEIDLKAGEVYQGRSRSDLTGTKIKSISTAIGVCNKIAVFSGSSRISIACNGNAASDNLFQQVYPTSTWGKKYIAVPLSNRPFDIYRVLTSKPNTTIRINGIAVNPGMISSLGIHEFVSTSTNVIEANEPIQVVQYTPTQGEAPNCNRIGGDVGDPEMIFLSPIEQGLDRVTLYSSNKYDILRSYINVIIPASAASTFKLDGVSYTSFSPVSGDNRYAYAQIPVGSGTHNISAAEPFNAIAYGFGNNESYGYAAGTNLKDLSNYVAFQDPNDPNNTISSGCSDGQYQLQLTLPYQPPKLVWKLDDGTPDVTINNPVHKRTITRDNRLLYLYEYPVKKVFTVGSYSAIALADNPGADECGSTEEIRFDFIIYEEIKDTKFTFDKNCLGAETEFKDATVLSTDRNIKAWLWDFGDGSTSTLNNPTHRYATAGTYDVRLTVTDNNDCVGVSPVVKVHIATPPVVAFTAPVNACKDVELTFQDNSTSANGTVTKWVWDFGDNSPLVEGRTVKHIYKVTGTRTITLSVTTDNGTSGCVNVLQKNINVRPIPVVDFTTPDICDNDGPGEFIPTVSIADNTESEFTYLWDFGDPASGAANASTQKTGKHQYTRAGNYTVKYTVFSKYGCDTVVAKTFTVNSAAKPKFSFKNDCSSKDIVFKDESTIDVGRITKVVWCFDYGNNPSVTETFTTFPASGEYRHNYGSFTGTSQSRQYVVRMTAYSGQSVVCSQIFERTITVYPEPTVTVEYNGSTIADSINVCEKDASFQIVENKAIYSGTGVFTGTGISRSGTFSPASAGPGLFDVTYTFTTGEGCVFIKNFKVRVNPTPRVTVDRTVTILSGGEIVLNAGATISSGKMTYKWTPSTGLDRDDILKPVASPTKDIVYKLVVSTDKGCPADEVQIEVKVLQLPVIPNTFTPNADGVNDTWEIANLNTYPGATVEVFNRNGQRVFTSINYPTPWDGRYNGNPLPSGAYYYVIDPKNGRKLMAGSITIIR